MSNNNGDEMFSDSPVFFLQSYTRSKTNAAAENLLKLEEHCKISALGSMSTDSTNLSSLFYIDTKMENDAHNTVIYSFRSVLKPNKYVAACDNHVLFKTSQDIRNNCHRFKREMPNSDYWMFESVSHPGFYLTVDQDGHVYLSKDKQHNSWFKLLIPGDDVVKEIESVITSSNLALEAILEEVLSFEE